MLVNGDTGYFLCLFLMSSFTLRTLCWSSQGRMRLNIVNLAKRFSIFVKFSNRLEAFDIYIIRFNGFAFFKGPNFLHFLLI